MQYAMDKIRLRPATEIDGPMILSWRNDPLSRQFSFQTKPIDLDHHMQWWKASLLNPTRTILVLENEAGQGIGSLRKDKLPTGEIELSWMIAPEHRGKGFGSYMLNLGLSDETARYIARIKPENKASCRMVEKLGFSEIQPGIFVLNTSM